MPCYYSNMLKCRYNALTENFVGIHFITMGCHSPFYYPWMPPGEFKSFVIHNMGLIAMPVSYNCHNIYRWQEKGMAF